MQIPVVVVVSSKWTPLSIIVEKLAVIDKCGGIVIIKLNIMLLFEKRMKSLNEFFRGCVKPSSGFPV